jgi:REP element-mobilizing transposase RayT
MRHPHSTMKTWNDTDAPLAYLITFCTYGTWLPGDARGSIDRFHNEYLGDRVTPNPVLSEQHRAKLKSPPATLDATQRSHVEIAIANVCKFRKWDPMASNVRTNHVHLVAAIGSASVEKALNDLKAYSTRGLRENGCWQFNHSPWVNKGSLRRLWNQESIGRACDYVINRQGEDLRDFL